MTFTGLILSAMNGGYISDCISIFERMNHLCTPNIGTINAMLKAYGCGDMFTEAKELFESIEKNVSGLETAGYVSFKPDEYTYSSMLEISASAHQWEYFEYVYREMALYGYQLDLKKNAGLLVGASRAGKVHCKYFVVCTHIFMFISAGCRVKLA